MYFFFTPGHDKIIRTLVELGANVNVEAKDKWIPLHYAALGRPDAVRALLELGANIFAENSDKETPRQLAENHREII